MSPWLLSRRQKSCRFRFCKTSRQMSVNIISRNSSEKGSIFNPFLTSLPILYLLKTPKVFWCFGGGYEMGTLARNGLMLLRSRSFPMLLDVTGCLTACIDAPSHAVEFDNAIRLFGLALFRDTYQRLVAQLQIVQLFRSQFSSKHARAWNVCMQHLHRLKLWDYYNLRFYWSRRVSYNYRGEFNYFRFTSAIFLLTQKLLNYKG